MVSFRRMNKLLHSVERTARLLAAKQTKEDPDTVRICSDEIDLLRQMQNELKPMIDTLPCYEEQMILNLRFMKGYSYDWIAQSMNYTPRSVYYKLRSAKTALLARFPDQVEE